MELVQMLNKAQESLNSSPIRQYFKKENPVHYIEFKDSIEKVDKDIGILQDNLLEPVKIVLMGEVKAGKSTLLNSIAGDEVSPMDVVEATAAIIEVYYSRVEEGIIIKKNGEEIKGTLAEIKSVLKEHHRDLEFFNECEIVKVGMPLKNLKKVRIVDTPGIGTITEQNSKKAEEFIQKADVILWVFNGNQLGQEDIEDEIIKIAKMGKKIVGIINKIDEIDGNPNRLIAYMEQNLGIYIDEFYAVSSYMALTGIKEQDESKYEESGLLEILDYIEENIEREPDKVHLHNIYTSIQGIINSDFMNHKAIADHTKSMIEMVNSYKENIDKYNKDIKAKISSELNSWYKNELFVQDQEELLNLVGNEEKLNLKFKESFNNSRIQEIFQKQLMKLKNEMEVQWDENMSRENEKIYNMLREHSSSNYYNYDINSENNFKSYDNVPGLEISDTVSGLKNGAVAGMALSGYVAWLGPGAAHISIGAAMGAVMPPALIVGAAVGSIGLISKAIKTKEEHNERKGEIISVINEMRETSYENIKKIEEHLFTLSDSICSKFMEKWEEPSGEVSRTDEIYEIQEKVDNYTKELGKLKEELARDNLNLKEEVKEEKALDLEDLLD